MTCCPSASEPIWRQRPKRWLTGQIWPSHRLLRLYHHSSPRRAYQEFTVQDFRDPQRVRQFLYLFRPEGLLGSSISKPLALELPGGGYNGKLFEPDKLVDDLQLEDEPWTNFFPSMGKYDFRDEGEVNVEVLGNLFERSITELKKRRTVGLFGKQAERVTAVVMPKSAERKRFGIYYTPPELTRFIVPRHETAESQYADLPDFPIPL